MNSSKGSRASTYTLVLRWQRSGAITHSAVVLVNTADGGPRRLPKFPGTAGRMMTADRFAAVIGLTARTVRSYHARGLLPPPDRIGRTPCYTERHLARMRQVSELQNRGLSLVAVRALLEPDLVLDEVVHLGTAVSEVVRRRPALGAALMGSGVLIRNAEGALELNGVRAVLAARSASARGGTINQALPLLAEAVEEVMPHAEAALREVLQVAERRLPHNKADWRTIQDLTVEVVRVCMAQMARPEAGQHCPRQRTGL